MKERKFDLAGSAGGSDFSVPEDQGRHTPELSDRSLGMFGGCFYVLGRSKHLLALALTRKAPQTRGFSKRFQCGLEFHVT